MRRVTADIAAKKQKLAQHKPATAESRSAQDAAKAPPDDKEAQGKAANAEKMNAAKPGEFDKVAFIAAVNEAIAAQAPKNLDEADKFADSGKAEKVKGAVDGKVTDGKKASAKDIETTTKAAPDTSKAKEKQVVPLRPDQPPANPGAPSAEDATPRQQPPEVTDFSEGPRKTDQQMADADVTEEQLARSNEPEFTAALGEKRKAEQHSATAPAQARTAEKAQLATAKSGAAAAGAQAMSALTATRTAAGKQVDGGKGEAKSKDEQKRAEVTAKLQKVFDATQKDVEGILEGLDGKVDKQFEEGEKKARDAFTTDQKRRMKAYKDKRYGGFWGPAKWAKDKIAGMPEEANQLFQESRKLYVRMMQGVISSIADTIGTDLGKAKARIAKGRAELKAEVDKLPADLKKYGEEAAKDFAGKFDDLESEVDDKSKQLVQTLAQKYTQALNAVDEEIKKLQEANKGLVQKAVDAVAGVIKTIKELKDLLMGILAKAAAAITKIIKDPIGFLGNLVRAVGAGLQQFVSNIGTHLQSGLVSWLLGTAVKAGIEIPSRFDLKGIIQLIASLLGLTWANIRDRITRKGVPDQAMNTVEQSVPVAKALATEGPAGAVNEIQAEVGDLKSTILEELKSYLIPTVIIAGITWIISLLNPASAFVRAVKGIIDIVTFIVNQGAQIVQFVNAVLDAVVAIANGGSAGVPKMVETALAASVPLLIGFLASLLGIGGLANKIRQVFQKVARPVNRAIDKIAARIAQLGKQIWSKRKERARRPGDEKRSQQSKGADKRPETVRKEVSAELRKVLPPGVDPKSVDSRLRGVYRKFSPRGLHGLHLIPNRENPLSFVVLVSASPYEEGHSGEAQKELESNAFREFLKLNPEAKRVYDGYEKARQEMLNTTQIQVDNLRMKTRDGKNGEDKVHGKDTPTTATGILSIGSGKEYKMGEFPSRAPRAAEKNGENHSEAQLLRFMFDRWTVYTKDYKGGGSAHLEINVTRTPCFEYCTPKIVDARSGKDSVGGKDLPADWQLSITVNAMSVYHGARENKKGEMYGGRKKSIEALKNLVKAGVRLGVWTPGSESLITAWASGELKMYPKDGSVMSPPTRDELREANIKLYRVLKELIYVPHVIGQDAYDAMLVEVPASGGGKKKLLKVPFAR
ncbi:phage tail protein [Streptomyces olivaceoviridis]